MPLGPLLRTKDTVASGCYDAGGSSAPNHDTCVESQQDLAFLSGLARMVGS